ncbi:hypothetical protein GSI_00691 [Ganoderma sinense ZZ0214-1]|uniref:Uncharacterized protein n=1 Tax=Ganoderma sinense ZZ0214-1 TaxID=1077348 RepID=A0A2G8ST95_9APHY|nr:hypothetical protein GSI_00691 [Ganoderma sinense ZZ0214-1]
MSTLPVLFREEQQPAEIWFMIWRELGALIDKDFKEVNRRRTLNDRGAPFYSDAHDTLRKDPRRCKAKLAFASAYSIALQEYGLELYEHVVLTTCGAVDAILDCARTSMLRPIWTSSLRATWIKHIDLILSDLECMKLDWEATREAWSAFYRLNTLTICYHPKEPAPLNQFRPIAAHLPPSLRLLRLRPWMEANDIPPQFPQILKGGAKGRILGLRQDFWWDVAWARDLQVFQNVPQIHLQVVVYVVWPPYSKRAAEKAFRGWTSLVNGGRLQNISVTLFPPNEGLDVQEAVKELEGDPLSEGKRHGYFSHDTEDIEDALPNILAYDWRKDRDGHWEVDMNGATARNCARDYGHFSYPVAAELDDHLKWGWYSSME